MTILCNIPSFASGSTPTTSEAYSLNIDKMHLLWHRAAVMATLKAKANSILATVPTTEGIVYKQCASSANTPVALAKCVVRLFEARDYSDEHESEQRLPPSDLFTDVWRKIVGLAKSAAPASQNVDAQQSAVERRSQLISAKEFYGTEVRDLHAQLASDKGELVKRRRRRNATATSATSSSAGGAPLNDAVQSEEPRLIFATPSVAPPSAVGALRHGTESEQKQQYRNVENLRRIHQYAKMTERCKSYMAKVNDANAQFVRSQKLPFQFRLQEPRKPTVIENVMDLLNGFIGSFHASKQLWREAEMGPSFGFGLGNAMHF